MTSSSNSSLREASLLGDVDAQKLINSIVATHKTQSELVVKLHPFLHRTLDIDSDTFSFSPMWVMENVHNYGLEDFMFVNFASAVNEFVKTNKGLKRLHPVDIRTHRSFQLTDQFFTIEKSSLNEYREQFPKRNVGNVRYVHKLIIKHLGVTMYIENLLHEKYHHVIIRPKYMRGNIDTNRWEVILYPQKTDYMIEYLD